MFRAMSSPDRRLSPILQHLQVMKSMRILTHQTTISPASPAPHLGIHKLSSQNWLDIAERPYVHDGITTALNNLSNESNDILLSGI